MEMTSSAFCSRTSRTVPYSTLRITVKLSLTCSRSGKRVLFAGCYCRNHSISQPRRAPGPFKGLKANYQRITEKNLGGKMTRLRLIVLAVLMTTIGLAFPSKLHAQSKSTTASLSGTVTDPSGARVANATVKVTNPENGIARTDTTSASGEFSFAFLVEGTYTLEVRAPGFKTTRQDRIVP